MSDTSWIRVTELMQKDDFDLRLSAIKQIPKIINDSNCEKFINEVVPFIAGVLDDEEDSLVLEALNVITGLIPLQNSKQNTHKFLLIVELGLLSYNSKVREESIKVYKIILKESLNNSKDFDPFELIQKLTNSISQKSRIAFLSIIPFSYKYLNSNQKSRVTSFMKQFSIEGNEFTKKSLSLAMKDLSFFINEDAFMNIVSTLLESKNESVRIPIMNCIANLKYHQNLNLLQNYIQQVITTIGSDESWRVRYTLAININEILSFSILTSSLKKEVIKQYCKLFIDQEVEIRIICVKKLANCLEKLKDDEENLIAILDSFEKATLNEKNVDAKNVIAESVISISKYIPKDKIKSVIVPICYELLKKSDIPKIIETNMRSPKGEKKRLSVASPNAIKNAAAGDNKKEQKSSKITSMIYDNSGNIEEEVDVQLKIIRNLPVLSKYLNHDFEEEMIKAITEVYLNCQWKSKAKLIVIIQELIPLVSKKSLTSSFFNLIISKGLQENVFLLREVSIKCLIEILIKGQDEQIEKEVISYFEKLKKSSVYQQRNLCGIFALNYMKNKNHQESTINNVILPLVTETLMLDRVANIRFNAAQTLIALYSKKAYTAKVKPYLNDMLKDNDLEVRNLVQGYI